MTTAKRNRPSGGTRAASKSRATDYIEDSSLHRAEDGYAAPTADERREAELLAEVRALGYTVAVRCTACNHPLTDPQSTALHIGPRCRAKAVTE